MVGERIRALRTEKGLSMKDMAGMLGITISAWNKYEKNEAEPKIENLIIISDVFDVSLDFLLGRTNIRDIKKIEAEHLSCELIQSFEKMHFANTHDMESFLYHVIETINCPREERVGKKEFEALVNAIKSILILFDHLIKHRTISEHSLQLYQSSMLDCIAAINSLFNIIVHDSFYECSSNHALNLPNPSLNK
ncbi:MAG: family transcriptional regulator [Oscillospiraceae bacterium]|nr:family transcriptional regulator [Oscillospiraceae bacterium]